MPDQHEGRRIAALHRAVATLAIIKVNWDEHQDYIANFIPLVASAIRSADSDEVSIPEVQSQIQSDFGLTLPQGALRTILNRAARDGLVRREHGIYRRNEDAL